VAIKSGVRLGPYEVIAGIGAGGMGEVYSARDTRLDRVVAVKILPSELALRSDMRERFEREARTVASLNHPHICTVFDIGRQDGVYFLVMEHLEGATLADRLHKGPLPLPQVLRIAAEIADALAKAHARGVIHRDLKPGNIMLTRAGAKLLDFGLAKLKETQPAGVQSSQDSMATAASPDDLTREGMIVGTVQYMAPEQVEGRSSEIDARTDIFALGAVLYEMATGKRPFESNTTAGMMGKILEAEPAPMPSEQRAIPPALERVVRKCLRKLPDERWQSARDLSDELRWLLESASSGIQGVQAGKETSGKWLSSRSVIWSLAALLLVVGVAAVAWVRRGTSVNEGTRATVHVQRLTDMVGLEETPALSPDGKTVAFVAALPAQGRQIWIRLIAGGEPLMLTRGHEEHYGPRWSPDSASLIYFTPGARPGEMGTIWEISALGGAPRRLEGALIPGDLSRNDGSLAYLRHGREGIELAVAARTESSARTVARLPAGSYSNLRWSSDGRWLAYIHEAGGASFATSLYVVDAAGGEPRQVSGETAGRGFAWLPDSSGFVVSSAHVSQMPYPPTYNLWKIALAGGSASQITFGEVSYEAPDIGRDGALVASRLRSQSDVWRIPVAGGKPLKSLGGATRITQQTGTLQTIAASPDESEAAVLSDNGGHANVWIVDLENGRMRALTRESDPRVVVAVPAWSPRGDWINYLSSRGSTTGDVNLWLVRPDGSEPRDLGIRGSYACWSGDGQWLYYSDGADGSFRIRKVPVNGGEPVTVREDNATGCAVTAHGTALYYATPVTQVTGVSDLELRVAHPENGPSQVIGRVAGGRVPTGPINFQPQLSPDGKWLAMPLLDGSTTNLWAVSTADGEWRRLTDFEDQNVLIARRIAWSRDGTHIYVSLSEVDSDIVMMAGLFQTPAER
jgi:Tol biopolymer transport system component/tRNA A-37 threonylcarbamoyl transferase component Bud32